MGTACSVICVPHENNTDYYLEKELMDGPKNEETQEQLSEEKPKISSNVPKKDDNTLFTEFEQSIINKDFDNAMALIESYPKTDFLNYSLSNGDKALHYAIRERNVRFAYYLLQNGCDPNIKSKLTQDTSLHIATKNDDLRIVILLMKFKANINIENGNNQTPSDIAIDNNFNDITDMFEEQFQKFINNYDPTKHEYGPKHSLHFGDYTNAQTTIKSAFHIDGQTKENNEKRKIWKPTENDSKQNENNTLMPPETLLKKHSSRMALMMEESQKKKNKLPKLGNWLEKQMNKPPYFYQKRYLTIIDSQLIWNDKIISSDTQLNNKQKNTYKGSLSLLLIKNIRIKEKKNNNNWWEFRYDAPNPKSGNINNGKTIRVYSWKCKSQKCRDNWVNGLKEYYQYYNNEVNDLNTI